MFRQVVAHQWALDTDEASRAAFREAMEGLRSVPEVAGLRHGADGQHFPGNHDYVSVLDFPDFASARRYVASGAHQTFVADHASRVVEARVVVQHEWAVGELSGLHHVKLPVADVAQSLEWYRRAFDFRIELEFREDAMLVGVSLLHSTSGLRLALRQDAVRAKAMAGFDTMCLAVGTRGDLDDLLGRLDDRGVAHSQPFAGRNGDAVDIPDPDGHVVRIHTLI